MGLEKVTPSGGKSFSHLTCLCQSIFISGWNTCLFMAPIPGDSKEALILKQNEAKNKGSESSNDFTIAE